MDQLMQAQLTRTKILMDALEVAKICDNPIAGQLSMNIRRTMNESQILLDKTKAVVNRQNEITEELDRLANKCDILAERAENINEGVFSNLPFNTSTPSKNENKTASTDQFSNGLEVSPCPAAWYNGVLESPMPPPGSVLQTCNRVQVPTELQFPQIRMLQSNEMQGVPAYMKGRLTSESVNSFINTLNSILKQKYSISLLKRKEVKRKDLVLYCEWKSQEQEFGMCGKAFFTNDDLLNLGNQKLDKMTDKIIQILRHTNRLRQTRANGKIVIYSLI